ncbi:dTMP kinase [bacterium]|nr:dTMP kinase [bacterium]
MRILSHEFQPSAARGFVALEGVNGAGKSTLQQGLARHFQGRDLPVCLSREPGGTPLGTELRGLLLDEAHTPRTPLAEALLFTADRAQHVEEVITPALARQELVILDRFYYSTIAFQGYGRGLSVDLLRELSQIALQGVTPDVVILIDLDPQVGLDRNSEKGAEDAFEQEQLSFHKKLRNGFLELAESEAEPCVVLDGAQSADHLLAQAIEICERVVATR